MRFVKVYILEHIRVIVSQRIKSCPVVSSLMSEASTEGDGSRDECRVLTEVALRKASEKCAGDDAMKEQLRMMLGYIKGDDDPDCSTVLNREFTEEFANSASKVNQWVFCYAWNEFKNGDSDNLGGALEAAWAEARARAEENGVEI